MHKLTKICLKKPVSTVIIILALLIFGLSAVVGMNMQLTPDMEYPMIIAFTVYPKAGPEEVDRLVSQKLESVGATVEGLDAVMARSMENMSYVIYSFNYGTNLDDAYTDLQEEISMLKSDLPDDAQTPTLIVMDINAMQSMTLSVTSKSGADVRSFVENTLDPDIASISKVARTDISGGAQDYISVQLDPEKLNQYGLNMSGIAGSITAADFTMPSGSVDMGSQTLNVNTTVEYSDLIDLENVPLITSKGSTIRLADVADVHYATKERSSVSRYNSQDNVSLNITKKQGSNAVALSSSVKKVIQKMSEKYPDMEILITYDSSDSIVSSLSSVGETLILGVLLSMLVLFIFFGDFKASLIVGSSMPISLLVTLVMMGAFGFSLNIVTMGAMVIGIGMMVDNSIVVLEMCFQKKDQGYSFEESAYDAVKTVAMSVTASTITTIVVYLPLALMEGLSGQLFSQLGFTIIFSLTASLIAAVTLVPLCFAKYHPIEKKSFPVARFVRKVADGYGRILPGLLNRKFTVILVTVALIVLTALTASKIHTELMPQTDEGTVSISATLRPGLSLERKDEVLHQLEDFVAADPDVENYDASASGADSSISVTAYLEKKRERTTDHIADEWNEKLADWKDAEIICSSSGSSNMSMANSDKTIAIRGKSLEDLRIASKDLANAISTVDGVIRVTTDFSNSSAKAEIRIDPIKATGAGVVPQQAAGMLYSAKNGTDATDLTINNKEYKVTVEYPKDRYGDVTDIMSMMIPTNFGTQVALSDIADIYYTDSPQTIFRQDKSYQVSVVAKLNSEKKYDAQTAIDEVVSGVRLPNSVSLTADTYSEMMNEEFMAILKAVLIAMWLVFMVMTMQFESARYAGMIMFCIPFSLIGSVLLLLVTQATFSMVSLMGFLMLEGIVVNNGILMVDTTNQMRETMSLESALVEAGKSRLRPILMTTLTTILSMVPMALGVGQNGKMMQGMAVVIVGGLIASTILTLILLPTFYMIIGKRTKTEKASAKKNKNRRNKKSSGGRFGKKKGKEQSEEPENPDEFDIDLDYDRRFDDHLE